MNDYQFGNYIFNKRKEFGITQNSLSKILNVSNKAVSKWENGKSKPSLSVLKKLSKLWDTSIEDLLNMEKGGVSDKQIFKIVITGGPCAGKSTAMSWVQDAFTQKGYSVLFVPETATELITGGVAPWTCSNRNEFQKFQLKLQLEKEKIFEQAAHLMQSKKVLIVCDRGGMDGKAYVEKQVFDNIIAQFGLNEIELRDSYDAVFHLVTAAKGAKEFYTTLNNTARTETPEQAAIVDERLIFAWTGHPHFRVINNQTDFEGKMKRLIAEISCFLGEPVPYEIERKFLIKYPDISWLESEKNCQKVEIIQTYLKSSGEDEIRVRQRGQNGNYIYTKTTKKKINGLKRVEIEKRLSQEEYLRLLMDADTSKQQIRKTRYCLTYKDQYFEIDIFPFWQDVAIVEIELKDENSSYELPKQLHVIKEVTNDENYKNFQLANINNVLKNCN